MKPGAVIVDVAIDQGGCFETSRPTTHARPDYEVDGVVHYCVANMPGAVPHTSTHALTNATLPYVVASPTTARRGGPQRPRAGARRQRGGGHGHLEPVAEALGHPYVPLAELVETMSAGLSLRARRRVACATICACAPCSRHSTFAPDAPPAPRR